MAKIKKYGIDISEFQSDIDLAPYKDQFVIIRAGYSNSIDTSAVRHIKECEKYDIPYGLYWYSYATTVAKAKAEADTFLKFIKEHAHNIRVGVWLDMEDADGYKAKRMQITEQKISDICAAFCEKMETAGYYTGIYASASWFKSLINCAKWDRWVACWGSNNGAVNEDTSNMGTMLQYTSHGGLDKDLTYVDLSVYDISKKKEEVKPVETPEVKVIKTTRVKEAQAWLNGYGNYKLDVDGKYGPKTLEANIKALQKFVHVTQDGIIGPITTAAVSQRYVGNGSTGNLVSIAQCALSRYGYTTVAIDGMFGPKTEAAVRAFQKANKIQVDGIVGVETFKTLLKAL